MESRRFTGSNYSVRSLSAGALVNRRRYSVFPRRIAIALLLSSVFLTIFACAPALPVLSGGAITPPQRFDLIVGAASRIPFGALRTDAQPGEPLSDTQPGGVAPLVVARTAPADDVDLGVALTPTSVELTGRYAFKIDDRIRLIGRIAPYFGWPYSKDAVSDQTGGRTFRVGAQTPWVIAIDEEGIYQAWAGLRVAAEYGWGRVDPPDGDADLSASGLRTGALIGFALGFRRLWALIELDADYEWWWVERGQRRWTPSGIALTPAFALQLRL